MTWPTASVNSSNVDAGTDVPSTARNDFLDLVNKINAIIAYGAPLLPSSSLDWSKVTGTPTTLSGYGITDIVNQAFTGGFKNLVASATGSSATVSVSADELVVSNSGAYKTLTSISLSISGASSGANGLDSGSLATNTFYSVWVIWNGSAAAGLLSLSSTSPTLPGGYTHKARVGYILTDGTSNKYPVGFSQIGRQWRYKPSAGSNITSLPAIGTGVTGNISTPTWTSSTVKGVFVPSTAASIVLLVRQNTGTIIVAPNNSYGPYTGMTNPPPVGMSNAGGNAHLPASLQLESNNLYWASDNVNNGLFCYGWEDNL